MTDDASAPVEGYEAGIDTMRRLWGEEPVEMLEAASTDFSRDIFRLVVASCFGSCWSNDVLPPKVRSLITVAIAASLGRPDETKLHLHFALKNGCSEDELREMLKHVVAYAGAPTGAAATRLAEEVLAAEQPTA